MREKVYQGRIAIGLFELLSQVYNIIIITLHMHMHAYAFCSYRIDPPLHSVNNKVAILALPGGIMQKESCTIRLVVPVDGPRRATRAPHSLCFCQV